MKRLAIVFFFISGIALAQNTPAKPAANEWDVLDKAFISLIEALTKGDQAKFVAVSLSKIECAECAEAGDYNPNAFFVPAGEYFGSIAKGFKQSALYKALAKRGYGFSSALMKNMTVPGLKNSKEVKVYDVWVDTYLPGELSKGHPGMRQAFRFVKVNGKFKFYGIIS